MAKILFVSDHLANEGLGIMCLSAYLKANGHQTDLTLLADHADMAGVIEYVAAAAPDVVGFSLMTPQVPEFRPVCAAIKDALGLPIVWGGPHCMFMADDVTRYRYVDYVCIGEGEEALRSLMDRLSAGDHCRGIPGLWVREGSEWSKSELPNLEEHLDRYGFPDRELYYAKYPLLRDFAVKRVMSQRGCPYECSFCFEPSMAELYEGKGKLVRRRSVGHVIAEIKQIVERYPTRCIHFSDDTFNLNKRWLLEFADAYEREIDVPFTCNVTVQILDERIVRRLAEAGCRGMTYGLESGVERTRIEILQKTIDNQTYVEKAALLRRHGIRTITNVMFGLPHETLDGAIESIRFNRALRPFGTRPSVLKPYKGTGLARMIASTDMVESEGEFTLKIKDPSGDHELIENMVWAAYLFVGLGLPMSFARTLLSLRHPGILRHLVLVYFWSELRFFRIPLWQAWRFFWSSRKVFMGGMGKRQVESPPPASNEVLAPAR